jgi:hypothetical protein
LEEEKRAGRPPLAAFLLGKGFVSLGRRAFGLALQKMRCGNLESGLPRRTTVPARCRGTSAAVEAGPVNRRHIVPAIAQFRKISLMAGVSF